MSKKTRPTKKQYELLQFLSEFIKEHGYSPSYREIMRGCNYTSVATVALHVNNLIKRGHVVKRDKSARSLEVVGGLDDNKVVKSQKNEIISAIDSRLEAIGNKQDQSALDEIYVLVGALKILGYKDVSRSYAEKINKLKNIS